MLLRDLVLCLASFVIYCHAQTLTLTSIVSVYSTTTVSAPSGSSNPDDWSHACDNFVGACVVYGTGADGSAPYTTTVYLSSSPAQSSSRTVVTLSVTTIPATTTITAASAGACGDFTGACVVYGTAESATGTTIYASTSTGSGGSDGDGVIGQNNGGDGEIGGKDGSGQLGAASGSVRTWTTATAVGILALGFAFLLGL